MANTRLATATTTIMSPTNSMVSTSPRRIPSSMIAALRAGWASEVNTLASWQATNPATTHGDARSAEPTSRKSARTSSLFNDGAFNDGGKGHRARSLRTGNGNREKSASNIGVDTLPPHTPENGRQAVVKSTDRLLPHCPNAAEGRLPPGFAVC